MKKRNKLVFYTNQKGEARVYGPATDDDVAWALEWLRAEGFETRVEEVRG